MIRVRLIDDKPLLLDSQLHDFSVVLGNALKIDDFHNAFTFNYDSSNNTIQLFIENEEILMDHVQVSMTDQDDFEVKKNEMIDGLGNDQKILVVDYCLNKDNSPLDKDFCIMLNDNCDYELIVTAWSNYRREIIKELTEKGCYFVERAAYEDPKDDYLNWRATTSIDFKYSDEVDELQNVDTLKHLCRHLTSNDNVNLRYFGLIILLVGKVIDNNN